MREKVSQERKLKEVGIFIEALICQYFSYHSCVLHCCECKPRSNNQTCLHQASF